MCVCVCNDGSLNCVCNCEIIALTEYLRVACFETIKALSV